MTDPVMGGLSVKAAASLKPTEIRFLPFGTHLDVCHECGPLLSDTLEKLRER